MWWVIDVIEVEKVIETSNVVILKVIEVEEVIETSNVVV